MCMNFWNRSQNINPAKVYKLQVLKHSYKLHSKILVKVVILSKFATYM